MNNNLSNVLLHTVNNKSEFLSQFKKELVYINKLSNKIFEYSDKINLYENLYDNKVNTKKFLVTYTINISFLKANTMVHISDIKGNVKLFYTSGSVNLTGKQKRRRVIAILKLLKLIYKNASFLYGKPIALHLNNVNRNKFLIVKKLKQKFFIKVIREFKNIPYNGCRKPKMRRKKYKKILRLKRWLSGLKRQTVNLLSFLIVGSNPALFLFMLRLKKPNGVPE